MNIVGIGYLIVGQIIDGSIVSGSMFNIKHSGQLYHYKVEAVEKIIRNESAETETALILEPVYDETAINLLYQLSGAKLIVELA